MCIRDRLLGADDDVPSNNGLVSLRILHSLGLGLSAGSFAVSVGILRVLAWLARLVPFSYLSESESWLIKRMSRGNGLGTKGMCFSVLGPPRFTLSPRGCRPRVLPSRSARTACLSVRLANNVRSQMSGSSLCFWGPLLTLSLIHI